MTFRTALKNFRLRRLIFARGHRNPLVKAIAKQCWKNYSAWQNQDFMVVRNGEAWIAQRIADWFRNEPRCVFADVGANFGEWTEAATMNRPWVEVHAFEILPSTFEALSARIGSAPNVHLHSVGLSGEEGELTLFLNRSSQTTGLYHHPGEATVAQTTARVVRGDRYLRDAGAGHVHFCKIDVEGAEHNILTGLREMLDGDEIDAIQFEYGIFNIASRRLLKDFYALLGARYAIGKLFPNHVAFRDYSTLHEDFGPANYIAVRRELAPLIRHLS